MFSVLIDLAGSFFVLSGLFMWGMVLFVPMKPPADGSNRIAHLILVWEALKSPHRFVGLKNALGIEQFRYLSMDLGDFIRGRRREG